MTRSNLARHLWPLMLLTLPLGCPATPNDPEQPHGHDGHDDHAEKSDDHDEHGGHAEPGVVTLSPEAIARSGIQVEGVTMGSLEGIIEVPAEVELNPDRLAHISTLVDGQLLTVSATLGDHVKVNQDIARIRSVALGQARAELSRTLAIFEVAKRTLVRQERLREEGINSERRLLEAQLSKDEAQAELDAARSRLRVFGSKGGSSPDMTLQSPIAGVVMERHATQGEYVTPADTLFLIADLSKVWVMGRVYEQHIAQLKPGMQATLMLNAYPGKTWEGNIDYISPRLDDMTRTLPIRVEIENPEGVLRPGLFGTLRLMPNAQTTTVVMAPESALVEMKGRTVVFLPGDHAAEFVARPVMIGRSAGGQVEILKGLDPKSTVVTQGSFVLKSELMKGELGDGHAH